MCKSYIQQIENSIKHQREYVNTLSFGTFEFVFKTFFNSACFFSVKLYRIETEKQGKKGTLDVFRFKRKPPKFQAASYNHSLLTN
jgi:hypothetical protein